STRKRTCHCIDSSLPSMPKEPGRMKMSEAKKRDYQAHMRQVATDPKKIVRGKHAREERRARSKERITIRIDRDVLERFKDVSPEGQGYRIVNNDAVGDCGNARGGKELIREELERCLNHAATRSERIGARGDDDAAGTNQENNPLDQRGRSCQGARPSLD